MENVPGTFLLPPSEVQLSTLCPVYLSPTQAGRKVPVSFFFLLLKAATGVCS